MVVIKYSFVFHIDVLVVNHKREWGEMKNGQLSVTRNRNCHYNSILILSDGVGFIFGCQ